jgi:hypothetical protein
MSDPQRRPDDHPRRAEPLQPDKPGRGLDSETPRDRPAKDGSLRKSREQEDSAVDNAREGYD